MKAENQPRIIGGMDAFTELRAKARQKRDAAIQAARDEYRQTVRDIKLVCRAVGVGIPQQTRPVALRRLHRSGGKPFHELSIVGAAERILSDGKPRTLLEIAVELKTRGYPTGDNPRRVTRALREAFRYHKTRFRRGKDGRWGVIGGLSISVPPPQRGVSGKTAENSGGQTCR